MRRLREGDRVQVRGMGGRRLYQGEVAQVAEGAGEAFVVPDGKAKPRRVALACVSPLERAAPSPGALSSPPQLERPALRPQPRPKGPARDAAHWAPRRGVSQKVHDYRTVPLCREHHHHFHDHGHLPGLSPGQTRAFFSDRQVELVVEWFRTGGAREVSR
ncbi:MAG: hypothetical protein RLP09_32380 [Sandaracinaceae bacterium]